MTERIRILPEAERGLQEHLGSVEQPAFFSVEVPHSSVEAPTPFFDSKLAMQMLVERGKRKTPRKRLPHEKHLKPLKRIVLKAFPPGNKGRTKTAVIQCPHGQCFMPGGEQDYLEQFADALETEFPGHEYKMVEVSEGHFNFVHVAYPPADSLQPIEPIIKGPITQIF